MGAPSPLGSGPSTNAYFVHPCRGRPCRRRGKGAGASAPALPAPRPTMGDMFFMAKGLTGSKEALALYKIKKMLGCGKIIRTPPRADKPLYAPARHMSGPFGPQGPRGRGGTSPRGPENGAKRRGVLRYVIDDRIGLLKLIHLCAGLLPAPRG